MNTTENITTEPSPKKADRWVLFLALTLCINYFAPMFTMITKNPPRGEAFREQVIRAMFLTLLPFFWSVLLLILRRTLGERIVAYLALLLSLLWLKGMIWLAENFYAA
jgi:glucan phosphoethanolaminetransferase (alkaline phosphatase superfamily)